MKYSPSISLALLVFLLMGMQFCFAGLVYLLSPEFMPYHAQAIQTSWNDLNSNYQGLYQGLMKGLGAGSFVSGVTVLLMVLAYYRTPSQLLLWLLPVVSVLYAALLTYASLVVYQTTPGEPPIDTSIAIVGMGVIATLLLHSGDRPSAL